MIMKRLQLQNSTTEHKRNKVACIGKHTVCIGLLLTFLRLVLSTGHYRRTSGYVP